MPTKVCTRCHVEKPVSEFTPHPRGQHLTRSWCKPCVAEYARLKRAEPGGKDRDRSIMRARGRALQRLAETYPEEFERLLTIEKAFEGLPLIPWDRSSYAGTR